MVVSYFSEVFCKTIPLSLMATFIQNVSPAGVSAEAGFHFEEKPALPHLSLVAERASSSQIKPSISPDQPVKFRNRYECKNESDKLSTIAYTKRGMVELIVWESNYFGANWTPAKRCETVTQRFQQFSDQRLLHFISIGSLNNHNIICIAGESGQCLNQGLLLTLEHQDKPSLVLRQLFNLRTSTRRGGKEVIDVERLLNQRTPIAPVHGGADTPN